MATIIEHAKKLIVELKRIQSPGVMPERIDGKVALPSFISAGDDRSILLSREMDRLLNLIARDFKNSDPVLCRSHTDQEWNREVRRAFGVPLADLDLDANLDVSAQSLIDQVRASLTSPQPVFGAHEHVFGCTLFGNNVAGFEIGPVRFEPRLDWLTRKAANKLEISQITARRLTRRWNGARLRKRKQSIDAMHEEDIIAAVGNCPCVCSVRTSGLASEAGTLKAQTAAHMAMAVIALRWETPSRTLDGFRLLSDPGVRREKSLTFIPGKKVLGGSSLKGMPHGPRIKSQDWASELKKHQPDFEVAGEAIAYFLSASGQVSRPRMMNTLAQAILWFHEACRESVPVMAVVKFSASLDALANGAKSGGIRRLITARLHLAADKPIRKDGPTMKAAVEEIYSDGRSRTIHGTNDKLSHDWTSTKALSEQFARLCLIMSLDWAASNATTDDPALLQR
ncbi:hypothetical protein [Mesorhizobium sp.]|uniref:hypothetical protein n=1 Tax=Mesorhizobium sp. TaxID=1871066 RepID=UPI000FEA33B2|nr:hypothetical protein [Mesorhizobium sp.]RWM29781.1 MAG: hypothetical protein EOR75_31885 [Mesorhizobium sp.]TJV47679.1 MAG: hypothetical protein E5Y01_31740 [Mesorhizobium sp.]